MMGLSLYTGRAKFRFPWFQEGNSGNDAFWYYLTEGSETKVPKLAMELIDGQGGISNIGIESFFFLKSELLCGEGYALMVHITCGQVFKRREWAVKPV